MTGRRGFAAYECAVPLPIELEFTNLHRYIHNRPVAWLANGGVLSAEFGPLKFNFCYIATFFV